MYQELAAEWMEESTGEEGGEYYSTPGTYGRCASAKLEKLTCEGLLGANVANPLISFHAYVRETG
jgi:hypothetical protein